MNRKFLLSLLCIGLLIGCGAKKKVGDSVSSTEEIKKYIVDEGDSTGRNENVFIDEVSFFANKKFGYENTLVKLVDSTIVWRCRYVYGNDSSMYKGILPRQVVSYINNERGTSYRLAFDENLGVEITKTAYNDTTEHSIYSAKEYDLEKLFDEKLAHLKDSIKCVDWDRLMREE